MKNVLLGVLAAIALVFAMALPEGALAQTVTKQPQFAASQAWVDLGNGPTEVLPIEGNGSVYTASGSGTGGNGGVSGTTLTLTGTPSVPPCVGCEISGSGITSGTTVTAFNGTTSITISAAMTVQTGTALAWGAACPTSGVPAANAASGLSSPINMRAGVGAGSGRPAYPLYTDARICAYGGAQGGSFTNFPIAAW